MYTFEPCYLLVDDDETFSRILARALARHDINCVAAANSQQALEQLSQHSRPITHAVVDLNMGEESGLNLIPKLIEQQPDIKIVVLTGYSSIATTVEAMKRGAINYLCKPASTEEIIDAFVKDSKTISVTQNLHTQKPTVDRLEWEYIQKTLTDHDGNISATARALGMHRRTLQRKLQKKPSFS